MIRRSSLGRLLAGALLLSIAMCGAVQACLVVAPMQQLFAAQK
jgi:hypothetical protein